jgi:hypothetical protein
MPMAALLSTHETDHKDRNEQEELQGNENPYKPDC